MGRPRVFGKVRARLIQSVLVLVVLALGAVPAAASYNQVGGGLASPSALSVGGQTDYSVSLTGRAAVVDVVLVLDTSGSMVTTLPGSPTSRWNALALESKNFLNAMDPSGFFTRGGRVGVVTFSDSATTAAAPSAAAGPSITGINASSPAGGGCISCGLQRATDLLTAIPGAPTHRQIVYLAADGADTGAPAALTAAITASNAAHIERRVIGIDSGAVSAGLEAIDSDGVVPNAASPAALASDFGAPPELPGATNISWTFRATPGFTLSSATASLGSVAVAGQEVTWTIPSLGPQQATLTFHATHAAASGCAATSLLSATTFSDAEGDAAPAIGLAPLTVTGCPPSGPTPGPSGPTPGATAVSGLAAPRIQRGSTIQATATIGVPGSSVRMKLIRRKPGKAKPQLVGATTRATAAAGAVSLSVKLNQAGRSLLKKLHTLTLQLQITVTPPSGQGSALTLVKTVTLKR